MSDKAFEGRVREFLDKKRIAIWGVEDGKADPGQMVAKRFRKAGIEVIAVNPVFIDEPAKGRASSLTRIAPPIEAVLVYVDRPQTMEAVDDCLEAGVGLVWLHDALSPGAAIPEAIERLSKQGVAVIPGLCPLLFLRPVDPGHFCIRLMLRMTGKSRKVRESVG